MNNDNDTTQIDLQQELEKYRRDNRVLKEAARRFTASKKLQDALFRIVSISNATRDMSGFYRELHEIVNGLTRAKNFYIALFDRERQQVTFPYFVDEDDDVQGADDPLHSAHKSLDIEKMEGGPTAAVVTEGNLLHLNAVQIGEFSIIGRTPEDWVGVPLKQEGIVFGALVVQSYETGFRYSERNIELLVYVSQHIATALRRKQDSEALHQAHEQLKQANLELEKRVRDRTRELATSNEKLSKEVTERRNSEKIQKALFEITELVSTSMSINHLFEGFHQALSELMYADNAIIALVSDDKRFLTFPYFADQFDEKPANISLDSARSSNTSSLTMKVLATGKPILKILAQEKGLGHLGSESVSWMGVPLRDNDQTFGVVVVQSYDPQHVHTELNLKVMVTVAKQISTAILRKKDAQALVKAHENLEKRVRERTSDLEKTIIKRRRIEKQLEHDSLHDSLTQLPNRKYLSRQLEITLASEPSGEDCDLALLFLDLDRFKIINDSLGHHIGDLFLIEVAKKLMRCMRNDDVVVRLGGDEFCILMNSVEKEEIAVATASRILKTLRNPVQVEQHSLITSASIGIRLGKVGIDNAIEIIGDADSAMYQAKHDGKNRYCLFDANIKKIVSQRLQLEHDLRDAIGTEQLELYYQPVIDLSSDTIVGTEALIRWKHPNLGFISPVHFIPIAEETGIIQELGESIVEMACEALHEFSQDVDLSHLYVNVNISAVQILSRTLDDFIRKQIARFEIEPEKLNAEITESILVDDFKAATQFVQELKAIGMKVLLDDFGTGYSSLSYLHQFPFDYIKLDRSFIQSTENNESNVSLIESIGFLAMNLDMDVVVEGVETIEQKELVKNLNYRFAQGFLFAKPLPKPELIELVKAARAKPRLSR